ncbi:GNAT family N-acetyltransferase [candidate division KSB1 bacterium]|nr:GNAT family N-acetyltransferase [candidate division KSB1 bacterium]
MNDKNHYSIRPAQATDVGTLLVLIRGIAEYEKLSHAVTNSEQALLETGFGDDPYFRAILLEIEENDAKKAVGFALYFFTYSTFTGKPTLYLEDLFVMPAYRSAGYGKALFMHLVGISKEKDCGRMEWSVLDWNEPAIKFYQLLGARAMDEWTVYRLDEAALDALTSEENDK